MKKMLKLASLAALSVLLLAACSGKEETKEPAKKEVAKKEETKKPEGYEKYAKEVKELQDKFAKYKDIEVAIKDGYVPTSGYVPLMGYHFQNVNVKEMTPDNPNTLLYVIDEKGKFKLVGVEWAVPDKNMTKALFDGAEWKMSHEASAHYDDGTEIPAKSPDVAPQTNPETGAKFTLWHPDIYSVHMYIYGENPDGLFADLNPELAKYNSSPAIPPIDGLKIAPPAANGQ